MFFRNEQHFGLLVKVNLNNELVLLTSDEKYVKVVSKAYCKANIFVEEMCEAHLIQLEVVWFLAVWSLLSQNWKLCII